MLGTFRPFRLQPRERAQPLLYAVRQRDWPPATVRFVIHAAEPTTGLDFTFFWQARRPFSAESSSSSYGLVIRLLLLLTWPHNHAITLNYRSVTLTWKGLAPF